MFENITAWRIPIPAMTQIINKSCNQDYLAAPEGILE
jgi:hypothetical protein